MMGFHLILNFNNPYMAKGLGEFWSRWHISLSTWFRDYVYIPLGGSRGGKFSTYRNLFITFLISGIWHGAAWNFVIEDQEALVRLRFDARPGTFYLLRPDQHVCARWRTFDAAAVQKALRRATGNGSFGPS